MFKMVWDAPVPEDEEPEAMPLNADCAAQALELAALTRPGPFGPRTIELGDYFGCFEDGRLVAMAGERMHAGTLREVSGVCTHPDRQRRGLARRLDANADPPTDGAGGNALPARDAREYAGALRLYEAMGFRVYRESVVRIVSPC